MSWEEHAAALADCFQGKALALPPSPAKSCSLQVWPMDPQCSLLASPGIPRAIWPPWARTQSLVDSRHEYR